MILTQSMADIDLLYGKAERMAMMNNFSFKVILEASDTETQDYFAKLIGYKPTKRKVYQQVMLIQRKHWRTIKSGS